MNLLNRWRRRKTERELNSLRPPCIHCGRHTAQFEILDLDKEHNAWVVRQVTPCPNGQDLTP